MKESCGINLTDLKFITTIPSLPTLYTYPAASLFVYAKVQIPLALRIFLLFSMTALLFVSCSKISLRNAKIYDHKSCVALAAFC